MKMQATRKTKILCTLGPASASTKIITFMVKAGMNAVRLNFSHGTHESHAKLFNVIRSVEKETKTHIAIVQDLQGPRIRLGDLGEQKCELKRGDNIVLSLNGVFDPVKSIYPVDYPGMDKDVAPGEIILACDGEISMKVVKESTCGIHCKVIEGGNISSHKGVNLPGTNISLPALTKKDLDDLRFGLGLGVNAVAVSFVREASDLEPARKLIEESGKKVFLIAKIEKPEALKNIDQIIEVVDGIMVARGDLGIEIPYEEVPFQQKSLIEKSINAGKFVITATQMLESMISAPVPTRAEAADVANAVFDGTDCLMLSGETAIGLFPVRTVETMSRIAFEAEKHPFLARKASIVRGKGRQEYLLHKIHLKKDEKAISVAAAIAHAAVDVSDDLSIPIVAFTMSGGTAAWIVQLRPQQKIIAMTPSRETLRQLVLRWGVIPMYAPEVESTDEMLLAAQDVFCKEKIESRYNKFVLVAGVPIRTAGTTNLLKIHEITET